MSKSRDSKKKERAFERDEEKRRNRGFANMDSDRQREIAAMGGRASHGGGRNPGDRNVDTEFKEDAVKAKENTD